MITNSTDPLLFLDWGLCGDEEWSVGSIDFLELMKSYEAVWGLCLFFSSFDGLYIFEGYDFGGAFIDSPLFEGEKIVLCEDKPSTEIISWDTLSRI